MADLTGSGKSQLQQMIDSIRSNEGWEMVRRKTWDPDVNYGDWWQIKGGYTGRGGASPLSPTSPKWLENTTSYEKSGEGAGSGTWAVLPDGRQFLVDPGVLHPNYTGPINWAGGAVTYPGDAGDPRTEQTRSNNIAEQAGRNIFSPSPTYLDQIPAISKNYDTTVLAQPKATTQTTATGQTGQYQIDPIAILLSAIQSMLSQSPFQTTNAMQQNLLKNVFGFGA